MLNEGRERIRDDIAEKSYELSVEDSSKIFSKVLWFSVDETVVLF